MKKMDVKILLVVLFFGLSVIYLNSCKNESNQKVEQVDSKSKKSQGLTSFDRNELAQGLNISFNEVLSSLSTEEIDEIDKRLRENGDISLELKRMLLNPIDRMKGTIHRFNELDSNIERLMQITGEDGQKVYPEKDSFYIFSQYSRVKKANIDENDVDYNPELRIKLLEDLNDYHKKKYNKILRDKSFTTQQFLDTFYLDKWTTVQTILYRGDTIQEITSINLNFDVGAVCPPICPEGI